MDFSQSFQRALQRLVPVRPKKPVVKAAEASVVKAAEASGRQKKDYLIGSRKTGIVKFKKLESLAGNSSCVTVIFIHYHPREWFAPGFLRLIESACHSGFRVVVVSNSRPSKALPSLSFGNLVYVQRSNIGYDFGALRDVRLLLNSHGLASQGRYVLINSSMINIASHGFGSDPILDQLTESRDDNDVLAVTTSFESGSTHIQTYFYSMSGHLFGSDAYDKFLEFYWQGLSESHTSPRDYAIKYGELRFTSWAVKAGYRVNSIFDQYHLPSSQQYSQMAALGQKLFYCILDSCEDASTAKANFEHLIQTFSLEWLPKPGLQHNPSQAWWALLLASNFLFVKREVLENPHHLVGTHAASAASLLIPLLEVLEITIPDWSDLHVLPHLVHASR